MNDNRFEVFPGLKHEKSGERELAEGESDFEKAMSDGVPEFPGEQFGVANESNEYYGESVGTSEDGEEFNKAVSDAASIINYGLNAASRRLGVEQVMQGINDFDPTGSSNPIGDLFLHLGVETKEDRDDIRSEAVAAAPAEAEFRESMSAPATTNRSVEGAFKAIEDVKDLVAGLREDPRYEELRNRAESAGMGYFEYAVKDFGVQDLAGLFKVLAEQKKKAEEEEEMKDVLEEKEEVEEVEEEREVEEVKEEVGEVEGVKKEELDEEIERYAA